MNASSSCVVKSGTRMQASSALIGEYSEYSLLGPLEATPYWPRAAGIATAAAVLLRTTYDCGEDEGKAAHAQEWHAQGGLTLDHDIKL